MSDVVPGERAAETVSGAIAAAANLPAADAERLLLAAFEAFTGSLHLVGVVGAVVFSVLAWLTHRFAGAGRA